MLRKEYDVGVMKDQYVADIGDYGKYSLLRAFIKAGEKVGVNWYLTEDDGTSDGKFTDYLFDEVNKTLRIYDPDLFDSLKEIVNSDRSIQNVEQSGILGDAIFYNTRMVFKGTVKERFNQRAEWHRAAIEQLSDSDLIFLDPDNGLKNNAVTGKTAEKYVCASEIEGYYDEHNIVFYCHKGRRTSEEWERYKAIIPRLLPSAKPVVVTYHKGTQRSYIFLVHPKDYERYREVLNSFLERWEGIFTEETIDDPDIGSYTQFALKWLKIFRDSKEIEWIFRSEEFSKDAKAAGCIMDCFRSFSEIYQGSSATDDVAELMRILSPGNGMTARLLASMAYSQWRYYNHWSCESPEAWVRDWFITAFEHLSKWNNSAL